MARAGEYELEELVASGGMADVYRGHDRYSGQVVAIKMPQPRHYGNQGTMARFRREHQMLTRLDHPSIVTMLSGGNDLVVTSEPSAQPYIAMEFLDGCTIGELLNSRRAPVAVRTACAVMLEILSALEYLHRRGAVHGDVAPNNVMVCTASKIKIMDFGAAYYPCDPAVTMPEIVARTPRYMAPEQALGKLPDQRTDVYAGGCLLYALLAGEPPFPESDPVALAEQHLHEMPPPLSKFCLPIPEQVADVVMRALNKQPKLRYQSAKYFRLALLAALRVTNVPARSSLAQEPAGAAAVGQTLSTGLGERSRSRAACRSARNGGDYGG
jgi:serine/threonine-protein kinase